MPLTAAHATLALMLGLQPAGKSPYSRIVLEECDAKCQSTPVCDEPVLWCQAPKWSGKHQKFTRYENFEEGVLRYLEIAEAMQDIARRRIWKSHATCEPPRHDHDDEDGKTCQKLRRQRPWTGTERQLRLLLTTVAYYESSYRRDVHDGTTLGDCDYKEVNGRRVVIEGSCRSLCLGQVKLDKKERTRRGFSRKQIVGTSKLATTRCIETVVDRLASSRLSCVANMQSSKGHHAACIMGVYGGVTDWRTDPRIKKRNKTYLDIARAKPKLSDDVKEILGLEE